MSKKNLIALVVVVALAVVAFVVLNKKPQDDTVGEAVDSAVSQVEESVDSAVEAVEDAVAPATTEEAPATEAPATEAPTE